MNAGGVTIEARDIGKRFAVKTAQRYVQALAGVSLDVRRGAVTALVGPDGAGKTTFLRLAAGLMRPDAGRLHVLGHDVARTPQAVQDRISYMPQRFGLYEDLSVQENLDLYADLHGVRADARRERYARLLDMTDLKRFTGRLAGKLSGGMKQKLGLACTLVRSPDLLLLDEPTVGVDPLSRRELWEIIDQMVRDETLTVLVATAYMDEAERCACVHVLHDGAVLASGAPADIAARADGLCFVVPAGRNEAPRARQARLLDRRDVIIDAVPRGGEVRFILRPGNDVGALADDGAAASAVPARLEDGFMVLLHARADETGDGGGAGSSSSAPAASASPPCPPSPSASAGPAPSPAHNGEPAIEVRDLVRKFGDFTAVDRTSFSVARGEIFGLLGPNGAGKTTTFRMLCGLLPASGGTARVAGMDLRTARAQARSRIGYVSQSFALYGNLSAAENLRFFGGAYGLHGARLRDRIDAVTQQFSLRRHLEQPAGQLAGGIKQRLAMAVGLLHEPEILFLDEPTSGADPLARRAFWRRITALAQTGTTVVITTHFMEEAEYCDRIVIQDAGKLLALGTPEAVRTQAGATPQRKMTMEEAFIGIVESGRNGAANGRHEDARQDGHGGSAGDVSSHGEDVARRQEGTPMSAAARPPEGGAPSLGEDVAQRQEGTSTSAPARPPEGRAPSHGEDVAQRQVGASIPRATPGHTDRGFRRRVVSLTRKEVRQLFRNRANMLIGLVLPIVLILIFGYGLSLDVRHARVLLVMEDHAPQARDLAASIALSRYLDCVPAASYRDAERAMIAHDADAVLRIPSDFSRRLAAGNAAVQTLVLGSDPTRALTVAAYLQGAVALWLQKQSDRGATLAVAGNGGTVTVVDRMWFNAANDSTWYLVPGLIVLIMTLIGTFLTALVMAREWERGTLEALFVTPVQPVEVLLAKIIPYFCVGMMGLGLCLLAALFLFQVPLQGSMAALVTGSTLYMLVSLGIGLLISALTRNQFVASQLAILASFMPATMLSGFVFDLRNVPDVVNIVGHALPATYFMELVKTVFLAGDYWPLILKDCAILAAYAATLLLLVGRLTRKTLDR
ncbi:hypothetical protein AKI39_02515 [Bordetella sp. H567]|nr:hypothetical protein AKI39_02515 [Bordetella sp. H567]